MGTDWLKSNKVMIDFEGEALYMHGEKLPSELVRFRVAEMVNDDVTLCRALCSEIENIGKRNFKSNDVVFNTRDYNIRALGWEADNKTAEIEGYIEKLSCLNGTQKLQVQELLYKHKEIFSSEPGLTKIYGHVIKPITPKTFVKRSYPVPLQHRSAVEKEIEYMMELGVIERSSSEFCNPLRVVVKKDSSIRLCLDARFFNKVIAADNESPPRIEELMQKYEGINTSLDDRSGEGVLASAACSRITQIYGIFV